ncbi:MAG: hypothetical protein LBS19_00575 [Clostridiales bacterium]|jgi:hypothetical protein|nr:hypothetical protein [Clostridiales bacterium]
MKRRLAILLALAMSFTTLTGFSLSSAKAKSGVITKEDAEGLFTVTVEDGTAEIFFDLESWQEQLVEHGMPKDAFYLADLSPGPYEITTNAGAVADVCIGYIEDMAYSVDPFGEYLEKGVEMKLPVIMLLMEDGTIEYTDADWPFIGGLDYSYTFATLPWLKDIVSIEHDKPKTGESTFYAIDGDGLRHDVRISKEFYPIFGDFIKWSAPLLQNGDNEYDYTGKLWLSDEEICSFDIIPAGEEDSVAGYTGTYEVITAVGQKEDYALGSIVFDFTDFWNLYDENLSDLPKQVNGVYSVAIEPDFAMWLTLELREGDPLFSYGGEEQLEYEFESVNDFAGYFSEDNWDDSSDDSYTTGIPELKEYLTGTWEFFPESVGGLELTIYSELGFSMAVEDEDGEKVEYMGYIEAGYSGYGSEPDTLTLVYEDENMEDEKFMLDRLTYHQGRQIMTFIPYDPEYSGADSGERPVVLAFSKKLYEDEVYAAIIEYDAELGVVWADPYEYDENAETHVNTIKASVAFPLPRNFDTDIFEDILTGDACMITLDENGEVISIELAVG